MKFESSATCIVHANCFSPSQFAAAQCSALVSGRVLVCSCYLQCISVHIHGFAATQWVGLMTHLTPFIFFCFYYFKQILSTLAWGSIYIKSIQIWVLVFSIFCWNQPTTSGLTVPRSDQLSKFYLVLDGQDDSDWIDKHNVSILVKCYVTLVQNNFRKCRRSDSDWWFTWLEMISCNHEWILLGCQCAAASNAASPDKISLFLSLSHTRFRSLC